jgi:Leucine-rich repeat (LRR) protein
MNIEELRKKSCEVWSSANRKALHEAYFNTPLTISAAAGASSSSGGGRPIPEFQFVVNTTQELVFRFDFISTGEPIEFTIDWGDGNIHVDSGAGGFYTEEHEYDEAGEYTVKVTFDDPLKVLELDFPGWDDDYSTLVSITGLQNLANLQEFRADYNSLVSVDFSGMANLILIDISDCDDIVTEAKSLTSVNVSGCTSLESLYLDDSDFSAGTPDLTGLNNLRFIDLDDCNITSIDLSMLPSLQGFDLSNNYDITNVIISRTQPLGDGENVDVDDGALTQSAVDAILVALSTNGVSNGYVDLRYGTNAIPSSTGLAAKATLEDNGWEVLVNAPLLPFDVTANWGLTTPEVVDEASFRTFLESGQDGNGNSNNLTNVNITDFSLVGNTLTCNLSANGSNFYLGYIEVSVVNSIGSIAGLEYLGLGNNQIVTFDPSIALPNSLLSLELNSNQIVTFDPSIALPSGLTGLSLGNNQIVTFNPTLALPSGLIELGLGGNQIVTFNPTLALPSGLTNLGLNENLIVTFNPTLALPSGLQELYLGNNQIVTFDPSIALPNSLLSLGLNGNQIVTFNPSIALPSGLQELYLNDSQMTTAGYTLSEPWANSMSVIPGRGTIYFGGNVNSISGTNLETILIAKGWSVNLLS